MKLENLKEYNRIITFDDDNHRPDIYINGSVICSLEDELEAVERVFIAGTMREAKPTISKRVYICDLPEEVTEKEIDRICTFFSSSAIITAEQEVALWNDDYKTFLELI